MKFIAMACTSLAFFVTCSYASEKTGLDDFGEHNEVVHVELLKQRNSNRRKPRASGTNGSKTHAATRKRKPAAGRLKMKRLSATSPEVNFGGWDLHGNISER
jgi:hypothetical protein